MAAIPGGFLPALGDEQALHGKAGGTPLMIPGRPSTGGQSRRVGPDQPLVIDHEIEVLAADDL